MKVSNEKGSITLFVLIAMIFFLTIAMSAYVSAMNKLQGQNAEIERIKASYEQDLTEDGLANLYEQIIEKQNTYTVKFDVNGGNVDTASKKVIYDKEYGYLPTPTREGYTFMGWNGKNLLNLDVEESSPSNTSSNNQTLRNFVFNTYVVGLAWENSYVSSRVTNITKTESGISFIGSSGYGIGFPISNLKENNNYALLYNSESDDNSISSVIFYNSSGEKIYNKIEVGNGNKKLEFTVPNGAYYGVIVLYTNGQNSNVTFNNVQLIKSTENEVYEPYHITSNTKVVQQNNHTLTAIWEES